jgi:large subunit ribosomal protein L9
MKVILLKDIPRIGKKYDVKEMSDGNVQNMLIPRGLALVATPDAIKRIDLERVRNEGERKLHTDLILKNLSDLSEQTIIMIEKANEKGHLFASIHTKEIVEAIKKQTQLDISSEYIALDKPIKEIGTHLLEVKAEGKSIEFSLEIKSK